MEQLFTISEVAKKNGLSAKTIQNTIKANPQLGIVMKPRVKTLLTYEQAAQISALVSSKNSQFSENQSKNSEIPSFSQNSKNQEIDEISQFSTTAKENSEIAELRKAIIDLSTRAAVAEKEAEMLREQVNDLKEQRDKWDTERASLEASIIDASHQLETAQEHAARAVAQADSLRDGVNAIANAGFFSRARMAKELSARAGRMMLEDGE